MLHILWVVIKFILIVLGILLGLLLLAVLLLLFCPVRYRASACKKGTDWKLVSADAGVSWLFGGISLRVWLAEGVRHERIRILGIPLDKLLNLKKHRREKEKPGKSRGARQADAEEEVNELQEKPLLKESPAEDHQEHSPEEYQELSLKEHQEPPSIQQREEEKAETGDKDKSREQSEEKQESGGLFTRILEKLKQIAAAPVAMIKKLIAIPGLVIQKIRNIALTFRGFYDKMDWWKQFVSHPKTQEAISLVRKHAGGLVKHVLPTKIQGTLIVGSEDPAVTGTVLALLGMSIPLHKNCIAVTPVFDGENILEGDVRLKGRIYGWVLLKAAVTIYFNKNVKYVISRWKHKEG
ncbi:MAG: DUF2953 domain-containing protein [Eubacteriales bacterium]|nr:DUF2953 domain-containing protein [Eubacteriales bacterium]